MRRLLGYVLAVPFVVLGLLAFGRERFVWSLKQSQEDSGEGVSDKQRYPDGKA